MNTRIFSVKTSSLYRQAHYLVLVSTSVLLAACATAPQAPTAQLLTAEQAIASAEQAQVNRFTSTELSTARTELAAARAAMLAKDMLQAERLAVQAQLSANLAMANAELLKARAINQDMQQGIQALTQEAQRNLSGVKP
ncbi:MULTISPECIES: DUF4398 domain-containing protein [unclassified Arsukibacterium]|uniref:DUF4398 domain-containing protein n=1 Tax=unclassified Arsukibacterium TaxID=2635278 RepID=UPI000C6965C4|nr:MULTISPECIES: DUF4398 domain-containing protein [unclassified Arsukibacterium]MAA94541.1 hypothetical protein [Rheinheimera sp.]MBM32877.1 hypothetical protein [Rheinheimera sp.]HAW94546.1 hypothetical protein [Candidatus Azambacteria bacterium]|tara:strand:+ start:58163 stop:58579 length:417 start_codon:yes stop_codon:yes gene_type:complete